MGTSGKIIAIVGPTASGKSDLAVRIAQRFDGEVVSADSRQIYRGLDIGSGKITTKEMMGVPHHLLDISDPKEVCSVSHYQKLAFDAIDGIISRGRLPIVAGGTGLYVQAIVDGTVYPEVKPDPSIRKELESKDAGELSEMLKSLDAARWKDIDKKNPRRLVRAIEIARSLGQVPAQAASPRYDALQIGLDMGRDDLRANIERRTASRMRKGMVSEAERLRASGVSSERMKELGLEYGLLSDHLDGKLTRQELADAIILADTQYAKRQMTWFKKDKRVQWFSSDQEEAMLSAVRSFLA